MDLIKSSTLFGFPIMIKKINKKSYDKESIISTIEKNFKLNKERNRWDEASILHHSYNDASNPEYHKVNFNTLLPVYKETLTSIFKGMEFHSPYRFDFDIVNYTCMSNSHHMRSHIHLGRDFTAVHYVQFDKKHHTSTLFENTSPYIEYVENLNPDLRKTLSNKDSFNSWAYREWTLNIEEDDFCLSPAYLKHRINPQDSKKKNRITIVLNISLKPKGKD